MSKSIWSSVTKLLQYFVTHEYRWTSKGCSFFTKSIKDLRLIGHPESMTVYRASKKCLEGLRPPHPTTEPRSFLGVCDIYSRFISRLTHIASYLYELFREILPRFCSFQNLLRDSFAYSRLSKQQRWVLLFLRCPNLIYPMNLTQMPVIIKCISPYSCIMMVNGSLLVSGYGS